jgi:hypothetical protein
LRYPFLVNRSPCKSPLGDPIRSVRSTLLVASRASLTANGQLDAYERFLRDGARTALRDIIAGTWLPVALAAEHYAACDALGLTHAQQQEQGRANGMRLTGTLVGTLAKVARTTGATPLTLIEQFPRFWGRIFSGGSLSYEPRGPKDVEIVVKGSPLIDSAHFRYGLGGTSEALFGLVCTRLVVRMRGYVEGAGTATYMVQWV